MTIEEAIARADQMIEELFEERLDISEEALVGRGATREEVDQARRELITEFVPWKRRMLQEYATFLRGRTH